jgi:hypothetical protein
MTFSFGQGLFNLPQDGSGRPPLPFENAQAVPKADNLSLSCGVHDGHSGWPLNVNEKRTKFKPLVFGGHPPELNSVLRVGLARYPRPRRLANNLAASSISLAFKDNRHEM